MYMGIPNPNAMMPLEKMVIENLDSGEDFTVLYNPQSYVMGRSVSYSQKSPIGSDAPLVQFVSGGVETLSFDLFFDSLYAGAEVGGGWEKLEFAANSVLPSVASFIDIRKYTNKILNLAKIDPSVHRPPMLQVMWASLQFTGFLTSCGQRFVKFSETGAPVRAVVKCTFIKFTDTDDLYGTDPEESPDTTKFHRVEAGDSLWSLAIEEYGQASDWRAIADANGLANPRLLRTGDMLRIPALTR